MAGPEPIVAGLSPATERRGRAARLLAAALPLVALGLFVVLVLGSVATSARWGYDYQAYAQAADRLLNGQRLYDPGIDLAGGFAVYLYPPPFAVAFVPFAIVGEPIGLWAWTAVLAASTVVAVLVMPVPPTVRWVVLLLAALSWPVLYAIRLGQVGPILLLLFAIGWRSLDRPAPLGATIGLGALVKVQPGLLGLWALGTGRWRAALGAAAVAGGVALVTLPLVGPAAWSDYVGLLGRVSAPVTTPHNFTPGAVLAQLGVDAGIATAVHWLSVSAVVAVAVIAVLTRPAATSYVVVVVATQLVSPLLWDHYAVVLLLPVAWLLARGHAWAIGIPLATSLPLVGITPPAAYPLAFGAALVAPLVADRRAP